jgi:hypothetical protein
VSGFESSEHQQVQDLDDGEKQPFYTVFFEMTQVQKMVFLVPLTWMLLASLPMSRCIGGEVGEVVSILPLVSAFEL